MKYKILVKCPWGEVGQELNRTIFVPCSHNAVDASEFPEIFQPIQEKSDADLLAEFICCDFTDSARRQSKNISECLLSHNAITPEFLNSLREKEGGK